MNLFDPGACIDAVTIGQLQIHKNHVETRDFVANDGCEGFARRVDGLNPETGHHENPGERLSRDGTIVHDQYAGGRWYVAIPHSGGGQLPRRPFDGYRSFCHDGYASTLRLHCGVGCASSGWISRRAPARRPVTGIRVYLPERRCNPSNPAEHFYLHAIHFDQMFEQLVVPLRDHRSVRVEADFTEETALRYGKHVPAQEIHFARDEPPARRHRRS